LVDGGATVLTTAMANNVIGNRHSTQGTPMSEAEQFDVVISGRRPGRQAACLGSGRLGKKVPVVERQWVGGSCPAVACMPSKNEI
jgi:hypothetical protein